MWTLSYECQVSHPFLVHCFVSLVNDKVEPVFTLYTSIIWEGFSSVRLLIADTVCVELGEVRWEKRKDRSFALMDWDPKIAGWDLTELEPNDDPNLGKVAQQSGKSRTEADCMDGHVDLKLGGSSELGAPDQPPISMEISSSSPSKRARAPSSGGQNFLCLVDGCRADLTACREYHRRHKVCEIHSKTPVVMVGGAEKRFCQQCSRFHLLVEFDEVKRSCRKRLDGHNRRRRKPQLDSASSANLFSIQQGTRFPSYSLRSQNHLVERNWAGIIKAEEDTSYARGSPISSISNQHVPGSFSHSYEHEEHIASLQDSKAVCRAAVEQSACLPPLKTLSSVESSQSKIFSDGMNQVLDSDCALSLLSSPTQTSSINIGQMLPADRIPMGQPFVSSFQYSSLEQYPGSQASRNVLPTGFSSSRLQVEQVGDVLVCDTDADAQCHGMFHVGDEGSSDGTSESLPFSWQ